MLAPENPMPLPVRWVPLDGVSLRPKLLPP
jgi:hypothetical protein